MERLKQQEVERQKEVERRQEIDKMREAAMVKYKEMEELRKGQAELMSSLLTQA